MSKLYKKISVVDLEELILSVKNLPVELDKNQFKIKKVRKTIEDWYEALDGEMSLPKRHINELVVNQTCIMPENWKNTAAGLILANLINTFNYTPENSIENLTFLDLGADSMDLIEVGLYIEDKLGIELSDAQSEALAKLSLGQLYNTLSDFLKK